MVTTLNTEKLAKMVRNKRGARGLREIANELKDVSISTLSRIEQGKLPDVDNFIRVCSWLGVPTDYFTNETVKNLTPQQEIVAHLRAEKLLDPGTAESLITMITLAYQQTKSNAGRAKEKK